MGDRLWLVLDLGMGSGRGAFISPDKRGKEADSVPVQGCPVLSMIPAAMAGQISYVKDSRVQPTRASPAPPRFLRLEITKHCRQAVAVEPTVLTLGATECPKC